MKKFIALILIAVTTMAAIPASSETQTTHIESDILHIEQDGWYAVYYIHLLLDFKGGSQTKKHVISHNDLQIGTYTDVYIDEHLIRKYHKWRDLERIRISGKVALGKTLEQEVPFHYSDSGQIVLDVEEARFSRYTFNAKLEVY